MNLFGHEKVSKGTVAEIAEMVHAYFKARNLDPKEQSIPAAEGWGWWVNQGSAQVYIFVQETKAGTVLRISSPLVYIPEDNKEAFYRKLLDLNTNLNCCALATNGKLAMVVAQRATVGLDQVELDSLVWNVAYVADLLDDQLSEEFKLTKYTATSQ
jgi:hypothetical protein